MVQPERSFYLIGPSVQTMDEAQVVEDTTQIAQDQTYVTHLWQISRIKIELQLWSTH